MSRTMLAALLGLVALGAGGIVLQRARRVARQMASLEASMDDRRYVWKVDAAAEATLPSRFNRGANAPPRPATELPKALTGHTLADELESLQLPPGPGSVGLTHRRKGLRPELGEPTGPPTGPPSATVPANGEAAPGAPAADGVQEPLPLAYGVAAAAATGPPTADQAPGTPAPAGAAPPNGPPAEPAPDASPFPAAGLSWRMPDSAVPPGPPAPAPAPVPTPATSVPAAAGAATPAADAEPERPPSPGDGAPDFASLVREYIRALRWKVD